MKKSEALRILGLPEEGASDSEVKTAHRKKVVENHPDRFALDSNEVTRAEEKTKLINEARDVLLSRKWEPEYVYRGPYVNPYNPYGSPASASRGQQSSTGSHPAGEWPFGQGQAQSTWVWTSWDGVVGQDAQQVDPFASVRHSPSSAEERKGEAKRNLLKDLAVIGVKLILLIVFGVFGSLSMGLFLYVVISIMYGLWKRLGGCLIAFFVPIAFVLVPFLLTLAPQAGMVTLGLDIACIICFLFDAINVQRGIQRYWKLRKSS